MYVPGPFAGTRDAAFELIEAFPFATVVASGAEGMIASHLPLMRDGDTLLGHLAGPNPQADLLAECARDKREVLAIFHGPHGYVSPTWYATKTATVPTWNYGAAHVYGVPRVVHDADKLRALVGRLAAIYETGDWRFDAQPPDFVATMVGGIVGFEIPIARMDSKFKLSQNRPAPDRAGVLDALDKTDKPLADFMRRYGAKD
jgi:transcriptional regulator